MKAIIKGCSVVSMVRQQTRHATPKPFTHLLLSKAAGRAFYRHLDPLAPGLHIFGGHDPATLPPLALTPEGGPMHVFAGASNLALPTDDQGDPLPPAERAALVAEAETIEVYIAGWVTRHVTGWDANGKPFLALELDDPAFLDSLSPAACPWRSDTMAWADCPAKYKQDDGSPRVDPSDVRKTAVVAWPGEAPE
jgi:hypothetical protein